MAGETAANKLTGETLRLPKLSHLVVEQLRAKIVSGELKAGDKLPPESELLDIYKVSRPTLREALRILEAESLISVARGMRSGATVLGPTIERAAEYAAIYLAAGKATLSDLHQARAYLEPSIARGLAKSASVSQVNELNRCVDAQEAAVAEGDLNAALDQNTRFHELLIHFSGNRTLSLLAGMLRHIAGQSFHAVLVGETNGEKAAVVRNMRKSVAGHRKLVGLIADKNADDAEAYWRRYMEGSLQFLRRTKLGDEIIVHE